MLWAAEREPESDSSSAKTRAALILTYRKNLDYCHQWIRAEDIKSLARTAGQLPILVDAVFRYTSEVSEEERKGFRGVLDSLDSGAQQAVKDVTFDGWVGAGNMVMASKRTLDLIEKKPAAVQPLPPKKWAVGFTPLMSLIDGTFADAKTAASVGDAAEAKQYALVIAELGEVLALDRNDDRWKNQSRDLVAAAKEAAASDATDPKELRAVLHKVYDRCEACHAVRRPQQKK